ISGTESLDFKRNRFRKVFYSLGAHYVFWTLCRDSDIEIISFFLSTYFINLSASIRQVAFCYHIYLHGERFHSPNINTFHICHAICVFLSTSVLAVIYWTFGFVTRIVLPI